MLWTICSYWYQSHYMKGRKMQLSWESCWMVGRNLTWKILGFGVWFLLVGHTNKLQVLPLRDMERFYEKISCRQWHRGLEQNFKTAMARMEDDTFIWYLLVTRECVWEFAGARKTYLVCIQAAISFTDSDG